MMNGSLKDYIEKNVLSLYDNKGMQIVNRIFERCLELINVLKLEMDVDMIYVICAFHDLGHQISSEFHEEISANIFLNNDVMKSFFNEEQLKIIADAIVDHRDSLGYEPRNDYGKLISSARKSTSSFMVLYETILEYYNKTSDNNVSKIVEDTYDDLILKYGDNGYMKAYYLDNKYLNFLDQIKELLNDKEKFINICFQIIDKLDVVSTDNKEKRL